MIREWGVEEGRVDGRLAEFMTQFDLETEFVKTDPKHAWDRYASLMEAGVMHILIDVDENDKIHGAIGFIISEDPGYPRLLAKETFWFVDPKVRGGVGGRLLNAYEEYCKKSGCSGIVMTHLVDSMADMLRNYYVKHGYKPMEVNYFKEI
jgi:GNAT superfamily N-acetyltransferase